ncbi:MAG: hypothetical protein ACHQ50_13645 [Fimbriimonadales bacterium]
MNNYQNLWWEQARSDHKAFMLLRAQGIAQCHSLHYLQMVTEKLAKAYFWRSGHAPPRSHAGFVQFLRFLGHVPVNDRERIANLFSFNRFADFQNWICTILPIAYDLERLAPALANEGPNPEYPWPHAQPVYAPVNHNFAVWTVLTSGQGRDLMRVIRIAVDRFPEYADT